MKPSQCNESSQHLVKCSTCTEDVDMTSLAEHVCVASTSFTNTPFTNEPVQMTEQRLVQPPRRGPSLFKRAKPSLPRLDSATPNRSGLDVREAASIAHDLGLPSPLSAGSGRRTPSSRKASRSRVPPGPRSPDLPLSQDCAFPAFPMNKPKRAQTDNNISMRQPRSASRSASRARTHGLSASNSTASSMRSSGSNGTSERGTSDSSSNQYSRQGTIEEGSSHISTAPSSPQLSVDGSLSNENGTDDIPPVPLLDSTHDNPHDVTASASPATPIWPSTAAASSPQILNSPSEEIQHDSLKTISDPKQDANIHHKPSDGLDPAVTFDSLLPVSRLGNDVQDHHLHSRQPSYKNKRPAPLLQTKQYLSEQHITPLSARSPTANSLSRTLTNLFSRKRSQSMSSKKMPKPDFNSPRFMALAPEPPAIPDRADGEFGIPKSIDEDYFQSREVQQEPQSTRIESPEAANKISATSEIVQAVGNPPSDDVDQDETRRTDGLGFEFKFVKDEHSEPAHKPDTVCTEPNEDNVDSKHPGHDTNSMEDIQRISVDSASSYGSVIFSNRTSSSRSSHPPSIDVRSKIAAALDPENDLEELTDMHPYFSTKTHEQVPDSPTDPLYSQGYLSPVPETYKATGSLASDDHPVEEKHQADSVQPELAPLEPLPHLPIARRASTPGSNKGTCRGCSQNIMAGQKSVSSKDGRLTGRYHKECFVCRTCKELFATADFYVHDDQPYCSHHYHVVNNTLCTSCGTGIEGQILETSDAAGNESKKFHPHCLTCSTCRVQLGDDYFEFHGRIYCERDAFRAANGPKSPYDNAPTRPSPLVREFINSEQAGVKGRFPERRITKLITT